MLPEKQMHTRRKNTVPRCSVCSSSEQNTLNETPQMKQKTGKWPHKHQLRKETHRKPLREASPQRALPCPTGSRASPALGCVTDPCSTWFPPALHSPPFHLQHTVSFCPSKLQSSFSLQGKESQGVTRASPSWQSSNTPFLKKNRSKQPMCCPSKQNCESFGLTTKNKLGSVFEGVFWMLGALIHIWVQMWRFPNQEVWFFPLPGVSSMERRVTLNPAARILIKPR